MAIWQYDLHLIPKSAIEKVYGAIPASLSREEFDRIDWWQSHQPPPEFASFVERFLPECEHWDSSTRAWGAEDGTTIRINTQGERIVEIFIRINVAELDGKLIRNVVEFAALCDALFLTYEGMLIAPDGAALAEQIKQSDALRFLRDPEKFLAELRDKRQVA